MHLPTLVLIMAASVATDPSTEEQPDCDGCDFKVFSIFSKDDHPAANIELVQFQYKCEDTGCTANIDNAELLRLQTAVTPITVSAFSKSKKPFWFMIKYALTPDLPATLEMKASIPEDGNQELRAYYDIAANLTQYHSKKGTVEVLFRYAVNSPAEMDDQH